MARFVVAWENRPTLDGRTIEVDALKPRSSRLPVFYNFSYTTALGWAEDFGRRLNPATGWSEISFEIYFKENWEAKLRDYKCIPTIGQTATVVRRTPYNEAAEGKIAMSQEVITAGEITCVSFGTGPNAWGTESPW